MAWLKRRGDDVPEVIATDAGKLAGMLAKAKKGGAGLVIIDTAPHSDRAAAVASQLADLVLIPCRPAAFDSMFKFFLVDFLRFP
jgi:chromosome partitioning protein